MIAVLGPAQNCRCSAYKVKSRGIKSLYEFGKLIWSCVSLKVRAIKNRDTDNTLC